jgi:O-antigen/teichoic acid export membrane protein
MLTSDVLNRATTFVLYLLVARYLGPLEFGQMSLALAFFYTFQVFASLGLEVLITREVARDISKTDQYIVNGSVVVILTSVLSVVVLYALIKVMNYTGSTAGAIMLMSIALFPFSLSVVYEAIFRAWERMHYIAYANVPANIAKVALAFFVLSQGYGIYALIVALLLSRFVIFFVELWFLLRNISRPSLKLDYHFSVQMVKDTATFMGIDGVHAISISLNVIILSKFTSEVEVGFYNAAIQLMIPINLVYQSLVISIFPMMCRKFDTGMEGLKRVSQQLLELLMIIGVPAAVGLFLLAEPVLMFLYGEQDFIVAAAVLRIMVANIIFIALTHALGQVLLASLREKTTLRIVLINMIAGVVFGFIFIPSFGLIGAAVSALLTKVVDLIQHYLPVSKLLSSVPVYKLSWRSVVASGVMAGAILLWGRQPLFAEIAIGVVTYGVTLTGLLIWSSGGVDQFKAKYGALLAK